MHLPNLLKDARYILFIKKYFYLMCINFKLFRSQEEQRAEIFQEETKFSKETLWSRGSDQGKISQL